MEATGGGGGTPPARGSSGRACRRKTPNKSPHQKEKDKRQRKPKTDGSQGTPQAQAGKKPATPNKRQKKSPFNAKMDPHFEEYWSKETVQRGLKSGDLIQGSLRINQRNFEDSYVDDPDGGGDYYISGLLMRNRALDRDVVVLQILPPEKWLDEERFSAVEKVETCPTLQDMAPSLNTIQPTDTATSPDAPDAATSANTAAEIATRPTLVDRLYTVPVEMRVGEDEGGGEGERVAHQRLQREYMKYRRTAKVVYIVEKVQSRACAGCLKAFDKEKGLALLSPKDCKIPRILIPLNNCPEDYCQNPKKYANTLFICRILSWERDCPFANGELLRSMGEAGEIEPETESFLIENDIEFGDFPPEALDCLPKQTPWTIPQEEEARRRDFRGECVFTIDPETARDLDDALHVKEVEKGVYEVGVHIADVSYFVQADTALDGVASQRATSVYLVQKVVPMLPRLLCEQLCSLNPNKNRLAFSVVWRLTTEGQFIDEWMGRSIICSCAKLSYSHAQAIIDYPKKEWKTEELPMITNGFTTSQVAWSVLTLNKLSKALRRLRREKGTLRLNQPKLKLNLSKDTGLPNGCDVYEQKESNRLIEEFMLLANMAVAHRIWQAFPEQALLRRHPMPKEISAQFLVQQCESLGIKLDVSSAASIQKSLDNFHVSDDNKALAKIVFISLCSKIMELARYFCTGTVDKEEAFAHFALNVPRYTHFTSPIRRYADIIVHRQLASVLDEGPPFTMTDSQVEAQADHCNKKKKSAKTVEELSTQMFFAIFISECGPLTEKGIVVQVLDRAFDVLVRRYGVIKRVYCEQLPLETFKAGKKGKSKMLYLTLEWPGPNGSNIKQELRTMSIVIVQLISSKKPLQYDAIIIPPTPKKSE